MAGPVLLCTDGSEAALDALRHGLELLGSDRDLVLVTVTEPEDPSLVTGGGFQGSVMTPDEFDAMAGARHHAALDVLAHTAAALGLDGPRQEVLEGTVGPAICAYAQDQRASAIVVGSRGRRGLKRALLGSVSDHLVRHAPCPLIITGVTAPG